MDASLRELSRTRDIQSCKLARKTADGQFNELAKELKPFLGFLQASPQVVQTWPKVLHVVKTKQGTFSILNHLSNYVQNFEKIGLLEQKEMLHLDDAVQAFRAVPT